MAVVPWQEMRAAMVNTQQELSALVGAALRKHQQRDFTGAEALYQRVLAHNTKHADALHLYGCLCDDLGRLDEAIRLISSAVKCNPLAYPYFYNLANMLSKQGRYEEAILQYRIAVRLKPDYAAAHNNLGLALSKQGDRTGAKVSFQKAIQSHPAYADPHYNLGIEFKAEGALEQAIAAYLETIRINPGYVDAHYNLGNTYALLRRPADAIAAFKAALRISPNNPIPYTNMGTELLKLGRVEEAIAAFAEALRLNPDDVLTRSNQILARCYATPDPVEIYAQCQEWERVHGARYPNTPLHSNGSRDPERLLRIGYVSADFRHHAASYWIEPLLTGHSHQNFSIYCYSNSKFTDAVTDRLRPLADEWVETAELDDDAMAERIRQDQIDILVDLSGHTDGNRLPVFARKPASVQISWFGFPVSTGLSAMDCRFSDKHIDPMGEVEHLYSEKLYRLSRFYAAFAPDPESPEVGVTPLFRNGFVTFASLNSLAKITPAMYALWAKILTAVPGSRLLMQSVGLEDPATARNVKDYFENQGISPDRLTLRGWTNIQEFLSLSNVVDIALDPFPFNGGVTTCQALWMGLPVVTLSGQSAASRVGRSILTNIGLPTLVAETPEQYLAAAVALAQDPIRLMELRSTLRQRMIAGGLLDGVGLATEVEDFYRSIWRKWCGDFSTV